jgi:hypothetical protein
MVQAEFPVRNALPHVPLALLLTAQLPSLLHLLDESAAEPG